MRYRILFEQTVRKERTVEADSYEEAVLKAIFDAPQVVATDMKATWVGTEQHVKDNGEFEHEVVGRCDRCREALISREIPGQPYAYGIPEHSDHELWCYRCLKLAELTKNGKEVRL